MVVEALVDDDVLVLDTLEVVAVLEVVLELKSHGRAARCRDARDGARGR